MDERKHDTMTQTGHLDVERSRKLASLGAWDGRSVRDGDWVQGRGLGIYRAHSNTHAKTLTTLMRQGKATFLPRLGDLTDRLTSACVEAGAVWRQESERWTYTVVVDQVDPTFKPNRYATANVGSPLTAVADALIRVLEEERERRGATTNDDTQEANQ